MMIFSSMLQKRKKEQAARHSADSLLAP